MELAELWLHPNLLPSGLKIVRWFDRHFDRHNDRLTDNPASRCHHHAGCQDLSFGLALPCIADFCHTGESEAGSLPSWHPAWW